MNYFEFVKELSLKNNKTFKEQLLDPETKKLWNQVRPVKVRKQRVKIIPLQVSEAIKPDGVKVDLSRAKIIPSEVKQEPDRMLDYYNQRWSNFVNTINPENFRNVYTIDKRPKELKPYNLDSIRYLLMDKVAVIEDSPLSYELSSYVFNPRVNFPGKRNIVILRNDLTNLSRQLKDINMRGQTLEFVHDFDLYQEAGKSLYEQIQIFENIFNKRIQQVNIIYLNGMMYTKQQLYSLIFLYGGFLTKRTNRDKYLIVVSNSDLGRNIGSFYKNLDVGYFNSANFEFGIPSATTDFNFSQIANYLSGTSSEIPISTTVKQPSSAAPSSVVPSSAAPIPLTSTAIPVGLKQTYLAEDFPHENPTIFPNQDKEFTQRIYFEYGDIMGVSDTDSYKKYKVGDFIYFKRGYLSQITSINKQQQIQVAIFALSPRGQSVVKTTTIKAVNTTIKFRTVRFIKPNNKSFTSNYTSLRNMAIGSSLTYGIHDYEDMTYDKVYNTYRGYFTDEVDEANVRGREGGLLQSNKGPNEFKQIVVSPSVNPQLNPQLNPSVNPQLIPQLNPSVVKPDEVGTEEDIYLNQEVETLGGALLEDDLAGWLSMFSLKGVDYIADVGNNQKAYLLSF